MVRVGVGYVGALCVATAALWGLHRAARADDSSASLQLPPWITAPAAAVVLGTATRVSTSEGASIRLVLSELRALEGTFEGTELVLHLTAGDGFDERGGRWRPMSLAELPELQVGQSVVVFLRDQGREVTLLPVGRLIELGH